MYANFSSPKNTTVDEYPDEYRPTQESLLKEVSSKCLDQLDKPSCSSQQEPIFEEYNQSIHFAIYDMDAQKCSKIKTCNLHFKETSCKEEKEQKKYNEIMQDSLKLPITKLNEIMLLKKQVVEYRLVSIAGHGHSSVFRFMVITDGIYAYGEGLSKKEAKKNAAAALLKQLDNSNGNDTITSTTSKNSPSEVSPLKYSKENISDEILKVNHISMLQELCMARRWELPHYEFPQDEHNEAHNVWYSVVCSLSDFQTVGEGKTKQAAKRQAAHIMYEQIKNVSQWSISKSNVYVHQIPSKLMQGVVESKDLDCSNKMNSLEMFFNRLKISQKPSLSKLRNTDSTVEIRKNAITFLNAIGEEEHFSITYILMSKKSVDIDMIVQLAVTPDLMFIGTGRSSTKAQERAAYVALSYIKHLLEQ